MRTRYPAAFLAMLGVTISVAASLTALAADDPHARVMQSAALAVRAVIDNERVTVWDTTSHLPPAAHDFVAITLSESGNAIFGHAGDAVGTAGLRTVIVELKDHPVAPI